MPVSSYILRCLPEDQSAVRGQLSRMPGVEIGEATERGIAVATETETDDAARALGEALQAIEGVRAAVLVYHNFEDVEHGDP